MFIVYFGIFDLVLIVKYCDGNVSSEAFYTAQSSNVRNYICIYISSGLLPMIDKDFFKRTHR